MLGCVKVAPKKIIPHENSMEEEAIIYDKYGSTARYCKDSILRIDMTRCPTNEEIDHMWIIVSTFIQHNPRKCVLHIRHIDTPTMDPPTLPVMLHLVTKLVNDFDKEKCIKVVIQPRVVDDRVLLAQQIFVNLLQSKVSLKICADDDKVQELIEKGCKKISSS